MHFSINDRVCSAGCFLTHVYTEDSSAVSAVVRDGGSCTSTETLRNWKQAVVVPFSP